GITGATSVCPMILAASIAVCFDMIVWPARMFCGPRASVPPLAMMTLMKPAFCFSTSSLDVSSSISTISLTGLPVWTSCRANTGVLISSTAINTVNLFIKDSPPRPQHREREDFIGFQAPGMSSIFSAALLNEALLNEALLNEAGFSRLDDGERGLQSEEVAVAIGR